MLFHFPEKNLIIEIRAGKTTKDVRLLFGKEEKTWRISHENWNTDNPLFEYLDTHRLPDIKERLEAEKVTAFDLLKEVTEAKRYPVSESADIKFGENVFSAEGKDLVDPGRFYVWYMARYFRLLDLTREDWQSFVSSVLRSAENGHVDPLSPPIVEQIIDIIKHSPIHDSFCHHIEENIVNGGQMSWFVIDMNNDSNIIYMPTFIAEGIRKREKLKGRAIRSVLEPILVSGMGESIVKRIGIYTARFWLLDIKKIYAIDPSISEALGNMLKCRMEKEKEENNDENNDERR